MKEVRTPSGLTVIMRRDADPVGRCNVCGVPFFSREEGERHMGPCARSHLDEIRAQQNANRLAFMDEENWDPEVAAYLQGPVRRKMEAEGRLTLKPNERAGL